MEAHYLHDKPQTPDSESDVRLDLGKKKKKSTLVRISPQSFPDPILDIVLEKTVG